MQTDPVRQPPLAPCECPDPDPDQVSDDPYPRCNRCGFRIAMPVQQATTCINNCPHVDDFIDDPETDVHASWFFMLFRLPESLKHKFGQQIQDLDLRLYCSWRGRRYRVTGCSRMGDVWLSKNLNRGGPGYGYRVEINELSGWSDQP